MHRQPPEPAKANAKIIHDLASQTGRSYEEAQRVYERELEKTRSEARVQAYVPVIAGKRAREALKRPR